MAIYIKKIGVWNNSQTMWDLFQALVFNAESMPFIVSKTLHTHARSCLCAHASWLHAQADFCVRMPRVSLDLLFQKQIYQLIKSDIFHFNISQVNLTSNWTLNQHCALEFLHHQGIGTGVVRGIKCDVYKRWQCLVYFPTLCVCIVHA